MTTSVHKLQWHHKIGSCYIIYVIVDEINKYISGGLKYGMFKIAAKLIIFNWGHIKDKEKSYQFHSLHLVLEDLGWTENKHSYQLMISS